MTGRLVHAPNTATGEYDLAAVAEEAGVDVLRIVADSNGNVDVAALVVAVAPGVAYRCAGGPLTAAIRAGADVRVYGADVAWFTALPVEVTGRVWHRVDVAGARELLAHGPAFVKLAAAKYRALPARRYGTVAALDEALAAVHAPAGLELLATTSWLPIASEYRTFTVGREVVAWSPYLIEDDPWTPLLHTHRASFHEEAGAFATDLLTGLADVDVPPTAVLDIARLDDGRFVLLEVNHVWSSGAYGCDPAGVLRAVLAAASPPPSDPGTWRWRPDRGVLALRR